MYCQLKWFSFGLVWSWFLTVLIFAEEPALKHDLTQFVPKADYALCGRPTEHLKNPAISNVYSVVKKLNPRDAAMFDIVAKLELLKTSGSVLLLAPNGEPGETVVSVHMHFTETAAVQKYLEIQIEGMTRKELPESKYPVYLHKKRSGKNYDELKDADALGQSGPQSICIVDPFGEYTKLLAPTTAEPEQVWSKKFQEVSGATSLLLIDVITIRKLMSAKLARKSDDLNQGIWPLIAMQKSLWEDCDLSIVSLDTVNGLVLKIQSDSNSAEAAERYGRTLKTLVEAAKQFLLANRTQFAQFNEIQPDLGNQLYQEFAAVLDLIQIVSTESTTKLTLRVDQKSLDRVAKLIQVLNDKAAVEK